MAVAKIIDQELRCTRGCSVSFGRVNGNVAGSTDDGLKWLVAVAMVYALMSCPYEL